MFVVYAPKSHVCRHSTKTNLNSEKQGCDFSQVLLCEGAYNTCRAYWLKSNPLEPIENIAFNNLGSKLPIVITFTVMTTKANPKLLV